MRPRIAIPFPYSEVKWALRTLPQYERAINLAGGEPVVVPQSATPAEAAQLAKTCTAIVLPGSPADIDPQKYGQARHPRTASSDPARDMLDELLLQDAHAMRKPILGVCYGVQSLNIWRGGTLIQHIESAVLHERPEGAPRETVITHDAIIERRSRLGAIIAGCVTQAHKRLPATAAEAAGKPELCPCKLKMELTETPYLKIAVNSYHHQAVALAGDGLRVVARSPQDGLIEAVENASGEHFVLGVQWHPERSYDEDACSRAIFAALVEAACQWHERMAAGGRDFETSTRGTCLS